MKRGQCPLIIKCQVQPQAAAGGWGSEWQSLTRVKAIYNHPWTSLGCPAWGLVIADAALFLLRQACQVCEDVTRGRAVRGCVEPGVLQAREEIAVHSPER